MEGEVNGTSNGNPQVVIGFDEICPPQTNNGVDAKLAGAGVQVRAWGWRVEKGTGLSGNG